MNSKKLNEAKDLFDVGINLINQSNFYEAEEKFIKCLDLFPGRLSVIFNLISIYVNTNQREKLKEILKNHKNLSKEKEFQYGNAFYQYFLNNFNESIKICEKIIQYPELKEPVEDLLASNFKKKNFF